jgi:tRNA threonylcarbamoyladenosine biosynthesis protein TsaE
LIEFPSKKKSGSDSDTALIAIEFMNTCKKGDRVVMNGDLGAGKTFFIKSALSSINIKNVYSPSFAIVNEYQNKHRIYHFDFYRLKNSSELFDIGWQDYLNDDDSIIFIEWGNRFSDILPNERIEINIEILDGSEREFRFEKFS